MVLPLRKTLSSRITTSDDDDNNNNKHEIYKKPPKNNINNNNNNTKNRHNIRSQNLININDNNKIVMKCDRHTPTKIVFGMAICFLSFVTGILTGVHQASSSKCVVKDDEYESTTTTTTATDASVIESIVRRRVESELKKLNLAITPRFSPHLSPIASGALRTSRHDFLQTFDFGPPVTKDDNKNGKKDVLILYGHGDALPSDGVVADDAIYAGGELRLVSAREATANCDVLRVFVKNNDACLVMMDDYESGHVQLWRKLGDDNKLDRTASLKPVQRGRRHDGRVAYTSPPVHHIRENNQLLKRFLKARKGALEELRPLAEKVADKNNTIIVLTCNYGQSALMMNFICSAKSKGFDLSNVLIFATDEETFDLAKGLGVEAYYNKKLFGELPKQEAPEYGGFLFARIMFAKIICVQMTNMLGYNVLFQDVDIIWYKNPLDATFHDPNNPYYHYDIVFQDDGSHTPWFTPYSANSGFYYVRYNERTRYLFSSFYYVGEMILKSGSHQQALTVLLDEYASKFGLMVKTIPEWDLGFPGGFHYHMRDGVMRDIVGGKVVPTIFHMSWTENKKNKLLFMRQMGYWYVNDVCIDKTVGDIEDILTKKDGSVDLVNGCCAKEPMISCHYRDKPSIIPCKDSPPIDEGRGSWWK